MFNNTFFEDIKKLVVITSSEAENLIAEEKAITIFVGRASCPYCQKFAKKIAVVAEETLSLIYFIDSELIDDELTTFRNKYNVVTVPGFIHVSKGHINTRCDSSMSIEEIKNMMN